MKKEIVAHIIQPEKLSPLWWFRLRGRAAVNFFLKPLKRKKHGDLPLIIAVDLPVDAP